MGPDGTARVGQLMRQLADALDGGASAAPGADGLPWVDVPPKDACGHLSMSLVALHAALRRAEGRQPKGSAIELAPGVVAYRRGRAWRIRIPRTAP
jgi:hypothetical protein